MKTITYNKSSESVSTGHPDKFCDVIADSIFDYLRTFKPDAQSAVEVSAGANKLLVFGEIDGDIVYNETSLRNNTRDVSIANPELIENIEDIVYSTIEYLGYEKIYRPELIIDLVAQSTQINDAVEGKEEKEVAAGDQGIVNGFAVNETNNYQSLHFMLAHKLMIELEKDRKSGKLPFLLPDAKSQVTVEYTAIDDGSGYIVDKPTSIKHILVSHSHSEDIEVYDVREQLDNRAREIVTDYIKEHGDKLYVESLVNSVDNAEVLINPAGTWTTPGPAYDSGLCLAEDTLVFSKGKGLVKIQDLNVGDDVVTETGSANIIDHFSNGEKETFVIEDQNGIKIEATGNHPFRVLNEEEEIVWRRADQLKETDLLLRKSTEFLKSEDKGLVKEVSFKGRKLKTDTNFHYLLGWLVGDDNTTASKQDRITFYYNHLDKSEKEHLRESLLQVFNEEEIKEYDYQQDGFMVPSKPFYKTLTDKSYISNTKAPLKTIPDPVLKTNDTLKGAFLRGLFDADGGVSVAGRNDTTFDIRLVTSSERLAQQVATVLFSMGIVSSIATYEARPGGLKNGQRIMGGKRYDVIVQGELSKYLFFTKIGFSLPKKAAVYSEYVDKAKDSRRQLIDNDWRRYPLASTVRKLLNRDPRKRYKYFEGSGRLSREHPYTRERVVFLLDMYAEFADTDEYKKLEYLLENDFQIVEIKSIEQSKAKTWDITLDDDKHAFVANGFVVHNTGRKLVVDNYGSAASIGGGASSGKNLNKVDRSGAYFARHIAKSIVASGLAHKATVELGFAIGVPEPTAVYINTHGTEKVDYDKIVDTVNKSFDFSVSAMIALSAKMDKFVDASKHGNYTNDDFPWEKTVELKVA